MPKTTRKRLLNHDEGLWLRLNPLYKGLERFLSQYPSKERLYVITTKMITYVTKILSRKGIALEQGNLMHADPLHTKERILSALIRRLDILPRQIYFVDDQVDNLIKAAGTGATLVLAEWGYCDKAQVLLAREQGIPTLSLDSFLQRFSPGPQPRTEAPK
jgi:phosphoglycolate phosphatase-like HAD superfamily hydrolase